MNRQTEKTRKVEYEETPDPGSFFLFVLHVRKSNESPFI